MMRMQTKVTANLFYATFIPGLQSLISDVIKERLKDVKIHKLLDGAVLFETATTYDKLNFFCFNNIFAVIDVKEINYLTQRHEGTEILERYVDKVIRNLRASEVIANNSK